MEHAKPPLPRRVRKAHHPWLTAIGLRQAVITVPARQRLALAFQPRWRGLSEDALLRRRSARSEIARHLGTSDGSVPPRWRGLSEDALPDRRSARSEIARH